MTRLSKRLPKRKMSPTPSHVPCRLSLGHCCSHGSMKARSRDGPAWRAEDARLPASSAPAVAGKPMRIIAFVTEVGSVQRILEYLGEPTTPPPQSPRPAALLTGRRTSIHAKAPTLP